MQVTATVFGCATRRSPTSAPPCTTLSTPSGMPASQKISTSVLVAIGVCSDGFSTSVLPVATHMGIIQPIGIMAGKLNGAMPANTPSGSR